MNFQPAREILTMTGKKFLCIQRSQAAGSQTGPSQAGGSTQPSPAQMQEMYARFNLWREKFSANIVDMGGRLGGGNVATAEGVKDGPFVEAKEIVGGVMVIAAGSLEEATKIAGECTGVVSGRACLEVREISSP